MADHDFMLMSIFLHAWKAPSMKFSSPEGDLPPEYRLAFSPRGSFNFSKSFALSDQRKPRHNRGARSLGCSLQAPIQLPVGNGNPLLYLHNVQLAGFLQDDWRVTSN